jgi:hypothetical protein
VPVKLQNEEQVELHQHGRPGHERPQPPTSAISKRSSQSNLSWLAFQTILNL